jgi:transposase
MSCLPALPGVHPSRQRLIQRKGDITIVTASRAVVIGADTHLDTIHVAALSETGKALADAEFPTRPAGYYVAVKWAQSFGTVLRAGVEGTSSYGAGFTRALQDAGIEVAEINRADRAARRRQGKSDPLDAYAAARATLAGHRLAVPKDQHTTALRALLTARRGAVKARTAAINQIKALLIVAPAELRERYRRHTTTTLVRALARCRPGAHDDTTTIAVLTGCKALGQRIEFLERQTKDLTIVLDELVEELNPALRAAYGVGPDTAAQLLITAGTNPHRLRSEAAFAMLCGTAPIPASSGKTTRHRLSRGGDRAANNALHRIALVRMSNDAPTRAYVTHQLANGRSKLDILRQLKRAIAREMFKHLTQPCAIDDYRDLRPARQLKNITLTAIANHFGVWPNDISRLERGLKRDDTLATNYRTWLSAA